jgi:hypothetical protein
MSVGPTPTEVSSTTLTVSKNAQQFHPLTTAMEKVGQIGASALLVVFPSRSLTLFLLADDVFSTDSWDKESPISCGFFTVKAGEPFTYTCASSYRCVKREVVLTAFLLVEQMATTS